MTHFKSFRFDEQERRLWRGGRQVHVTPKALAVLACLVEASGAWVSRDAILRAVWPDTHVHPDNIKVLIRELRVALRDDSREPQYIRSEPRRGYAFIAATAPAVPYSENPEVFVHRGPEVAAVVDDLGAVMAGESRLVLVTGDRGTGKSAFCRACLRMARALYGTHQAFALCGQPCEPAQPGAPLLAALRTLDGDRPWTAGPDVDALPCEGPFPTVTEPGVAEAGPLLQRLRAAFDAITIDLPLVLVLENLDRADPGTVDVLTSLLGRRSSRVLVIGTSRTRAASSPLAGLDNRRTREIAVRPLSDKQVSRYLDIRFGPRGVSAIAGDLRRESGGNPLVMVTLADALVARGLVVEADPGWQLTASPDTVAEMIAGLGFSVHSTLGLRAGAREGRFDAGSCDARRFHARRVAAAPAAARAVGRFSRGRQSEAEGHASVRGPCGPASRCAGIPSGPGTSL